MAGGNSGGTVKSDKNKSLPKAAALLRTIRRKNGLTQTEMGRLVGMGLRGYQRYESGEREPKARVIEKCVALFGVRANDFMDVPLTETSQRAREYELIEALRQYNQGLREAADALDGIINRFMEGRE